MREYLIHCPALSVIVLTIATLFSGSANSYPLKVCAADGVCGQVNAIDETQMAAVAGKFTIAGEVVGMNLTMTSSWQAANGQNLQGKAMLSVALPNSGNPQVQYSAQASGTDPQGASVLPVNPGATVSGGAGVQNVSGVSQLIQVAGDGNGASNRTSIDVTDHPLNGIGGNGQSNASYQAANGAEAAVNIVNNGVSLRLTIPDAGTAQQQVNAANGGDIHQSIQIAADRQQVANQLQLQMQVQPATRAMLAAQGFFQSLNMLYGR